MSETKKTAGQVAYETAANRVKRWKTCPSWFDQTDWERNDYEAIAAAVIEWHEATRPAWPPMRPMSELLAHSGLRANNGLNVLILVRPVDAYKGASAPIRMFVAQFNDRYQRWETGDLDFTWEKIEGWWPLPEVKR